MRQPMPITLREVEDAKTVTCRNRNEDNMIKSRLVFALRFVVASLCVWQTQVAAGQGASPGVRGRLEPAPDSTLNVSALPSIVIPRLPKAPVIDGVWSAEEWKDAEATRTFVVPMVGSNATPETRAWMGVDTQRLYLAVYCGLTPGTEPHASTTNHDGSVYEDDSVEFAIWPDRQSVNLYQIIVNSRGAVYDACNKVDPLTGDKPVYGKAADWNPSCERAVGRLKDAWILEMAIPLREVGIRADNVQIMRFNLWRNIIPGPARYSSWSTMPKINALLARGYGFGICSIPFAKGQTFQLGNRTDLGHAGLFALNGDRWSFLSTQRDDVEFTINLPAQSFADTPVLVTPTITPLLPGGTNAQPMVLEPLQIKSFTPQRLVIDGLEPGDYKLSLKISGALTLPEAGGTIMARKAGISMPIAGKVVFDDHDWLDAKAVATNNGVETAMTPGALLKTEFAAPVLCFDPTDDETITCMTEYKGKLYIGSCTDPAGTDTGSIFTYDPELHVWKKVFQVNEQGLIRLEVYGDTMYVPGYDANDGQWDLGNIYLHDGTKWIERRTVPRAVHTYGMAVFKDRLYLSADIFDEAPLDDVNNGRAPLYGRVVSSGDNGLTWREEYRGPTQGQDVGLLAVFKNQLVLNARGDLIAFNGRKWRSFNPNAGYLFVLDYAVDKDRLLMGTPNGLCYYDGERYWRSQLFSWGCVRGISRFGDYWLLSSYSVPGTAFRHGPGGTHDYPTIKEADPKTPKFWASLMAVPSAILEQDAKGDLSRNNEDVWKRVKYSKCAELPACIRQFRGRLFIGTHGEGRVMVLPVVKDGVLESTPRPIKNAGAYRLYFETATSPGTAVRMQVRCAATKESLSGVAFVGPDGTAETFFTDSGASFNVAQAGFLQYRAALTTQAPARTPY